MECLHLLQHGVWKCMCFANIIIQNKTLLVMFYRQHKTLWYQFCHFKHFLKAENSEGSLASSCVELPDITGRTALALRPDAVNAKYHVITNATYNRDPVAAKFKHVTNIDTCTLLCCDYSTLWEALHVNMVEIGARCSDKNVKILGRYQWIGWKRRTKMVGE